MRRLGGIALLMLLLWPASATADERQIARSSADGVAAEAGWVAFWKNERVYAGPGRRFRHTNTPGGALGTDRRGRPVILYSSCRRNGRCALREKGLTTGRTRTLLHHRKPSLYGFFRAQRHRGVLVVARNGARITGPGPRYSRITIRRPGKRTLRLTLQGEVFAPMDLTRDRLVLRVYDGYAGARAVQVVNIAGRRPRTRTLVVDDDRDYECRCATSAQFLESVSADGRYAYWLEDAITSTNGYALGAGGEGPALTRLFRTDLTKPRQVNEAVELPRRARWAAVDRGRIFYTEANVYELTRPVWQPVSTGRRNLGPESPIS